ncbi:hypothetical protein CVD28_04075 [Bacillus sp. M6-12]|uniref:ParM/StbA family protein n=1 Tax=Bacillus sp. M6-12 TaxID=2054166 RepID=UPI000C777F6F|nr:ParM/StbA family protein [Bacillus sp. M6-12]PLS19602.1 hypothetical protein CVD28_04075 [Bacillus sp. M6-12]
MTKLKEPTLRKVVVDSGKYATKAVEVTEKGELNKLKFRTKMEETDESITNGDETYAIEINGERYLIGKLANEIDWDTSKATELHRYSIYTAIHHFVSAGDEVALMVGCPLSVYTSRDQREAYEDYIKADGEVTITVNGEKKTFTIVEINALPETSGYLFKNIAKYKNKIFAVIDIGGLNANCCQYNGKDIIPGTDVTTKSGMNTLYKTIQLQLNKAFESNLQEIHVEQFMTQDKSQWFIKKDKEKSHKLILKIVLEHVKGIYTNLKSKGWDLENMDFIFVGGGSLSLTDEIKEVFGEDVIISETGVWDNAEGFSLLL